MQSTQLLLQPQSAFGLLNSLLGSRICVAPRATAIDSITKPLPSSSDGRRTEGFPAIATVPHAGDCAAPLQHATCRMRPKHVLVFPCRLEHACSQEQARAQLQQTVAKLTEVGNDTATWRAPTRTESSHSCPHEIWICSLSDRSGSYGTDMLGQMHGQSRQLPQLTGDSML